MSKNTHHTPGTPDTPDEGWEAEMSRELGQRVRDLNDAPFSLDHVKGRATTIRRNRRLAVAGSMLAAAAVIVPVAVISAQGLDGRTDRQVPATNSPSPSEAVEPPSSGLTVDYLEGKTWVRPDGSRVDLDLRYDGGTMLDDYLLATRSDPDTGNRTIDVIDQAGDVTESIALASELAANADHTAVAYVEPDGDLMTMWDPTAGDEGRVALETGLTPDVSAAALVGGPNCYEAPKGDGCVVYFNHGDGQTPPESASSHGITDIFVSGPAIKAVDVTEDGFALVQQSYSGDGSCSGIYDLEQRDWTWETCDYFLLDANRSGTHVAATHSYRDGIGDGWVAVLDTAGTELARIQPNQGFVAGQVWEDDDSLLVEVFEHEQWSVWRLGTDGSAEKVLTGAPGTAESPGYSLLAGS